MTKKRGSKGPYITVPIYKTEEEAMKAGAIPMRIKFNPETDIEGTVIPIPRELEQNGRG